ncbi:hypothetical protein CAFE_18180 [Caprobacter fermentans]|uniref:Uncharacterized protein n=1 Tax=Caproicibacter fermentans TaxID=2576756 RepID=A0A6N8HZV0_9FIRM|nr:hypothetical protein [Caproicibacter fermentans]MVB11115.1 hypothetical protein [Caproicibacter fermentans]OCN01759.1 hypothetical protein A7X67_01335 [Clostridium sp. W14A]QNK39308.1 hypothetical protein HCR03_11100 [Caproicibacter fermentans]
MDTLESMKNQLSSTGLYRLDGTTTVDYELAAYAEGLNALRNGLSALQAESYVATASDYGLLEKERACGLPSSGGVSDRRAALLKLGAVRPGACTKEGLESALSAFGLSVSLEEDAANSKIIAHFLSQPPCGQTEAQRILEIFCPAHLTAESDFTGVS